MTTHHAIGEPSRLPDISRLDRARFVKEARRLRAEQIDRLLLAVGRGFARLWRADLPRTIRQLPSGNIS